MTDKHTPGPWSINKDHLTAINAGDKHVAMVNYYKSGMMSGQSVDVYGEEHEANVCLIAAAPELLEAVIGAYNFLSSNDKPEEWEVNVMRKLLDLAIRKAKGEL